MMQTCQELHLAKPIAINILNEVEGQTSISPYEFNQLFYLSSKSDMRIAAHCLKKDQKHYLLIVNEKDFKTFESVLNKLRFSEQRNEMIKSLTTQQSQILKALTQRVQYCNSAVRDLQIDFDLTNLQNLMDYQVQAIGQLLTSLSQNFKNVIKNYFQEMPNQRLFLQHIEMYQKSISHQHINKGSTRRRRLIRQEVQKALDQSRERKKTTSSVHSKGLTQNLAILIQEKRKIVEKFSQ